MQTQTIEGRSSLLLTPVHYLQEMQSDLFPCCSQQTPSLKPPLLTMAEREQMSKIFE